MEKDAANCLQEVSALLSAMLFVANSGHHMEWGEWGWLWMIIMMIGGAILVAVVIYVLAKSFYRREPQGKPAGTESPLDIAKRRYAAGEIDSEQYEKIKRDIGGEDR